VTGRKIPSLPDYFGDQLRIRVMNDAKRMDVIGLLGPLRRYARSLTRNESQAEDLVQDTLVRAYERRSSFRPGGNLRGWLLSILHNTFIDHRRRRVAEFRRLEQAAAVAETAALPDQESRVRLQPQPWHASTRPRRPTGRPALSPTH
jgi:RNA polymerase sigma-70 factor (ECF subfamily)